MNRQTRDFAKKYSKTKMTLLMFAIFTAFAVPSLSDVAFANHLSEKMKW